MIVWYDAPHKVVLIGQAPSRYTQGRAPFSGRSGQRIAELAGIEHDALKHHFALANVLDVWPGPSGRGKGDAFPMRHARALSVAARYRLRGRRVVAFGHHVARVLLYDDSSVLPLGLCEWPSLSSFGPPLDLTIALVPHPSGVNRWWNDAANCERARRFLRSLVRDQKGRSA